MDSSQGTYYKALLLFTVFSLNTVVSFACSLGGLFHNLHHGSTATSTASHHVNHHDHKGGHKHNHASKHQHDNQLETENSTKDDCCSNNVIEIEKVEKSLSRTIEAPSVVFLTSLLTTYSSIFQAFPVQDPIFYPDSVRWRVPTTIQNLRIVIQSFQIWFLLAKGIPKRGHTSFCLNRNHFYATISRISSITSIHTGQ